MLIMFRLFLIISLSLLCTHAVAAADRATVFTNVDPVKVIAANVYEPIGNYEDHVHIVQNLKEAFKKGDFLLESQAIKHENSSCTESIKTMVGDLRNASMRGYSTKMLDAWGKPESGILTGNIIWEGRYFECRSSESQDKEIRGKWCSAHFGSQFDKMLILDQH